MANWLPWPKNWPTNPLQLKFLPDDIPYPSTLEAFEDLELLEAVYLLKLLCGKSHVPLNKPKRALLCVLATVLQAELYEREHPHH